MGSRSSLGGLVLAASLDSQSSLGSCGDCGLLLQSAIYGRKSPIRVAIQQSVNTLPTSVTHQKWAGSGGSYGWSVLRSGDFQIQVQTLYSNACGGLFQPLRVLVYRCVEFLSLEWSVDFLGCEYILSSQQGNVSRRLEANRALA